MKEITRIHIAKVAYDIEIDAKKDLENYIKALERYANDQEILDDIEIRITELLAEQSVMTGGVITMVDVAAVRARLGEPSDFASDEVVMDSVNEGSDARRIYRDENKAVLGGVLAGFGKFFGIDPLWVRLVFVVVSFASFGVAVIIYLILWLVIPPAQTAVDRLRMSGQSVTLASIKELAGGDEEQRNVRAQIAQRILSVITGLSLVLMSIAGILAIAAVMFGTRFGFWRREFMFIPEEQLFESWWFITMMGLLTLSGLLFCALCLILAIAAFRRQWSKRIGIAVIAIAVAGLLVFPSGVMVGRYGYVNEQERIAELREIVTTDLPVSIVNAKTLVISGDSEIYGDISYEVADKPYYRLDTFPGIKADIKLSDDGKSLVVGLTGDLNRLNSVMAPSLAIYGPALDAIDLEGDASVVSYYNGAEQQQLSINAKGSGSRLNVSGTYAAVKVTGDAYSVVGLESAAISDLSVEGGGVRAGGVRSLTVTQPDACPAHDFYEGGYSMTVRGISSGKIIYNGVEQPAKTISNSCGKVIVGDEYSEYVPEEQ